jgi:hypothetical protein
MPTQERRVRSLQIAFHNARGLRNSRNKLEIFADDHELDALLVSETNLNAGIADPKIRGYELYRSDRPHGPGGGTAIYVRRTPTISDRASRAPELGSHCGENRDR